MVAARRSRARAATAAAAAVTIVTASAVGVWRDMHRRPVTRHPSASGLRAVSRPIRTARPARIIPTRGRVEVATLPAVDSPGGRKVWIYRPGVPDAASVPVVYFLHGLPGSYRDLASLGVQRALDTLITTGRMRPFVLAVPDGNSTNAADPEWADSTSHGLTLEHFVIGPLRRLVEGSHPRDRAHRSIMGFSMGGYGAMNIALQHPEIYGAVASIAGYFDTDDESGVFDNSSTLLTRNRPDRQLARARRLRIMLADGKDDTLPVTKGETQRFASLLRANGVAPYVDIQAGTHSATYLQTELPRALAFLVQGQT